MMRLCLRITPCVLLLPLTFLAYLAAPFFFLSYDRPLWGSYLRDGFLGRWDGRRPLKFVFLTWGSRGDLQPNVALGLELARRGHKVTVMGSADYSEMVVRHAELKFELFDDPHLWQLAVAFGSSKGDDFLSLVSGYIQNGSAAQIQQYMRAGREADVLFGNHAAMMMLQHVTVAEALNKPLFLLTHDLTLPTADYSFNPSESRVTDYGTVVNMLNHRLFSLLLGAVTTGPGSEIRKLRQSLGLDTSWPFLELLHPLHLAEFPIVWTADPFLWKPGRDHPEHWVATGFLTTDAKAEMENQALEDWLNERDRPVVYFGQGSFDHHDRPTLTDIILDALKELHMDGVALSRTLDGRDLAPYPFLKAVSEVHQDSLFPRCEVVVHHGGAGTASQCIRSGRPGVCMPSMPFQAVWGTRLEEFGAGVVLHHRDMVEAWRTSGVNLLTKALKQAMRPSAQAAAKELKAQSLRQGGTRMAADKVLDILRREALREKFEPEL